MKYTPSASQNGTVKPRSKVPCENAPIECVNDETTFVPSEYPPMGAVVLSLTRRLYVPDATLPELPRNTRVELLEPRQTVTVDAESSVCTDPATTPSAEGSRFGRLLEKPYSEF